MTISEKDRSPHSAHVKLALKAIEERILHGRTMEPAADLPPEILNERAACFVSIKKGGNLRGCIGTIEPTQDCLAREIIHNAISAATRDPRFPPVRPDELPLLTCSVDVLYPPEPIKDKSELDPRKYGVVVECGYRRGLLLPDLEGVDTVEDQIAIASQKAGIYPDENPQLYRFEVQRYY